MPPAAGPTGARPRPTAPVATPVLETPTAIDAPKAQGRKFLGAVAGRMPWHGGHDMFVFHDRVVLTRAGRQSFLPRSTAKRLAQDSCLAPGVLGMRKKAKVLSLDRVDDVDVWQKPLGGRATFWMRDGSHVEFEWLTARARGVDPEELLLSVMPDRIDRVEHGMGAVFAGWAVKAAMALAMAAVAIALAAGVNFGVRQLLDGGPPAPPPPPPPTTIPANVQAARAELDKVCPAWVAFTSRAGLGDRPRPADLRPVVDPMRAPFDAAAASDPSLAAARDELAWLQDYARRTDDVAVREAAARIKLAMSGVDRACAG